MSLVNISFTGQQTAGAVRTSKLREVPPVETIKLAETSTEPPILILEPCESDAQSILQVIRGAGISNPAVIAHDYEEFTALVSTRAFAAVLSAFRLPSGNGLDALHFLRDLGHETPFLLVTGAIGEDAAPRHPPYIGPGPKVNHGQPGIIPPHDRIGFFTLTRVTCGARKTSKTSPWW